MTEILDQVRDNLEEIFAKYDEAAIELLRIACLDGHFADWDPSEVEWPEHPADLAGHSFSGHAAGGDRTF